MAKEGNTLQSTEEYPLVTPCESRTPFRYCSDNYLIIINNFMFSLQWHKSCSSSVPDGGKGQKKKEETGMEESTGFHESTGTVATGDSHVGESRRRPTWLGWVVSILVAVILSVTATLLLGGYVAFLPDSAIGAGMGSGGPGGGHSCCSPADAGK